MGFELDKQGRRIVPPEWAVIARKDKGVSQAGLARLLDCTQNTVSRREIGDSPVSYEAWLATLHALDLPKDWEPTAEQLAQIETKKSK